jgi:hypothetical protein
MQVTGNSKLAFQNSVEDKKRWSYFIIQYLSLLPLNFFPQKSKNICFLIHMYITWICYSVVLWTGFTEINHTCRMYHCHQLRMDETLSSEQSPSWGFNSHSATQEILHYLRFKRACHWAISWGRWINSTPWTNISHLFWIHYNIMFQSISMSSNIFWHFRFTDQNFIHFSDCILYALPKSLLHSPRFEISSHI